MKFTKTQFIAVGLLLLLLISLPVGIFLTQKQQDIRPKAASNASLCNFNMTDNFDGNSLDTAKWNVVRHDSYGPQTTAKITVQNGKATLYNPNVGWTEVHSYIPITGDFSQEMTFISNTGNDVSQNLFFSEPAGNQYSHFFIFQNNKLFFRASQTIGPVTIPQNTPVHVKMERVGTTFNAYYDIGSGYQLLGTSTSDYSGDGRVWFTLGGNGSSTESGVYDNYSLCLPNPPSAVTLTPTPSPPGGVDCSLYGGSFEHRWTISSVIPEMKDGKMGFTINGSFPKIAQCGANIHDGLVEGFLARVYNNLSPPTILNPYYRDDPSQVESISETQIKLGPVYSYTEGYWNIQLFTCTDYQWNGKCGYKGNFSSMSVLISSVTPILTPTPTIPQPNTTTTISDNFPGSSLDTTKWSWNAQPDSLSAQIPVRIALGNLQMIKFQGSPDGHTGINLYSLSKITGDFEGNVTVNTKAASARYITEFDFHEDPLGTNPMRFVIFKNASSTTISTMKNNSTQLQTISVDDTSGPITLVLRRVGTKGFFFYSVGGGPLNLIASADDINSTDGRFLMNYYGTGDSTQSEVDFNNFSAKVNLVVPTPTPAGGVNCDDYVNKWTTSSINLVRSGDKVGFVLNGSYPHIAECGLNRVNNINYGGADDGLVYIDDPNVGGPQQYNYSLSIPGQIESYNETQIKLAPINSFVDNSRWNVALYGCNGYQTNGDCRSYVGTAVKSRTVPGPNAVDCDDYTPQWRFDSVTSSNTGGVTLYTVNGSFPKIDYCGSRKENGDNQGVSLLEIPYAHDNVGMAFNWSELQSVSESQLVFKPQTYFSEQSHYLYLVYCTGLQTIGSCKNTNMRSTNDFTFTVVPTPTPTLPPSCPKKSVGDADCDGKVTIADFEQWRKEFLGSLKTKSADFDGNGSVTIVDFEIWRKGYLVK